MPKDNAFVPQHEILCSALKSGLAIAYDEHAIKQMRGERNIWRQDVWHVLETGRIVGVEIAHGNEERWKIAGENIDGFPLFVVIRAIQNDDKFVYVVTAFEPK